MAILQKESTKEHFTQRLHHHRDEARDNFVIPGAFQVRASGLAVDLKISGVTFKTAADFDRHLKLHMKPH